ncbi:MAG: DUF1553 domain-containing protein [Acidobacteriota bacterium]|nr:DUF1553 domain-containing protein [Acidobacteriota bacterium]
MLSSAYRQSSQAGADAEKADPDNSLLWRMPLRRLESEAIRDSMLAIAGTLNTKQGGPPVKTKAEPDGMVVVDGKALADPSDSYRRSIYLAARRRYNLSMLGVFDHPVMSTNATTRGASAVVLQSLMMMNDKEVLVQSRKFAERIARKAGADMSDSTRLTLAYRYAFGRSPAADELQWTRGLLDRERQRYIAAGKPQADSHLDALASVCHVLLNTNEFLYVE